MRMLVLDVFLQTSKAMSLADLEEKLAPSDRSTLYRTLKTFEKKGLIHGIQEHHTTQYLRCSDKCNEKVHHDAHLHFYCNLCKQTTCLEDIDIPHLHLSRDYIVKELKFLATGICKLCHPSE
ncbi:transcriptional regulator [Elizabethkingia argentiflava]|uniref:Transcriptional regulator n=2 Tax=Elizabethkingia argenteiflava TaxID=2681556 RepID=A0A845PWQ7_9FLAO|nr:transcriptional regulator [Elizabethkingia argenteiflava]